MRQTGPELHRAEGRKEGEKRGAIRVRREYLLRVLRHRFGELPAQVEKRVSAARDMAQLGEWFDRASNAATLDDVGIVP